jgi:hypothetical protein
MAHFTDVITEACLWFTWKRVSELSVVTLNWLFAILWLPVEVLGEHFVEIRSFFIDYRGSIEDISLASAIFTFISTL